MFTKNVNYMANKLDGRNDCKVKNFIEKAGVKKRQIDTIEQLSMDFEQLTLEIGENIKKSNDFKKDHVKDRMTQAKEDRKAN